LGLHTKGNHWIILPMKTGLRIFVDRQMNNGHLCLLEDEMKNIYYRIHFGATALEKGFVTKDF
jgi:hypothetical protein